MPLLASLAVLIQALIAVESGGDALALSPDGGARGCMQIRQPCLDDVNRIIRKWKRQGKWDAPVETFTRSDCFRRDRSIRIASIYLTYWGEDWERRTGKPIDRLTLAKIWHCGPRWYRSAHKTERAAKYAAKVRRELRGTSPKDTLLRNGRNL